MSSLRLALKQSLQETGHLFKEKKKKKSSSGKSGGTAPSNSRRRRPGDPPRKRGRPRKNPAPGEEEPARSESWELHEPDGEQQSESENEFSYDSEEEEDDSEDEDIQEYDDDDQNHDETRQREQQPERPEHQTNGTATSTSRPASPTLKPDTENSNENMDSDEERRRQKKILKKHLQQAANKIQTQWKKKTGISRSNTDSEGDDNKLSGEGEERSHSPMRSRDVSSNNSTPTNGLDKKKRNDGASKTQTVPPPEPEILEWSRSLSEKKSRKHITSGLRVKVRFAAKVKRDGKVVKKKIWYGGRVSAVSKEGSKIRIKYDDGTSEIAKFPDKDVVVDDKFNGKHLVPADKFIPPATKTSMDLDEGEIDNSIHPQESEAEQIQNKDETPIISGSPRPSPSPARSDSITPEIGNNPPQRRHSSDFKENGDSRLHVQTEERVTGNDSIGSPIQEQIVLLEETPQLSTEATMVATHAEITPDGLQTKNPTAATLMSESAMMTAAIVSVGQQANSHEICTPEGDTVPRLSSIAETALLPAQSTIESESIKPIVVEVSNGLKPSEAGVVETPPSMHIVEVKEANAADSSVVKVSTVSPKEENAAAPSTNFVAPQGDKTTKNNMGQETSPPTTKRSLTIRISNKVEMAPNTPKACSDSEEELLADTPITERRVKSIHLKGKSKRKREVESMAEEPTAKKRSIAKRETSEDKLDLLIPMVGESLSTNDSVHIQGAAETLSALGEAQPLKPEEGKKPHITISINLRKAEQGQENAPTLPNLKKNKERSSSPILNGRHSPVPRSRSPTSSAEIANVGKSERRGSKSSSADNGINNDMVPLSPKRTKVIARIKGTKELPQGTSPIDENVANDDDAHVLARSNDSTESLPNMRSGRRAAQQAKEKMHPKSDDRGNEPEKKKKKRKRVEGEEEGEQSDESVDDRQWVQCDSCGKWRILPSNVQISSLPKHWYCHLNTYDPKRNNCNAPEQTAKQAAKEWRRARKRAQQQRLVEMNGAEMVKPLEEPPIDTKKDVVETFSPKPSKAIKKEKLEAKRASPVASDELVTSSSWSEVAKLEKKGKKGKHQQHPPPPEEIPDVPPVVPVLEPEGPKKPGRKRGRPARNHASNKDSEDNENVEWVQCEKCEKWRKLPPHISADELPDTWYCTMNTWNPESASCGAPEDKADATHHEVGTYAGIFGTGAGKYSYRSMIFGTGKKHNRPMSERSRAAESLFMRPVDEIDNPYPTVMYSKSSCFLPRTSNFTKASAIEEELPPNIFDLLSNSELWAELRTLGQPMPVSSSNSSIFPPKILSYDNIPETAKQTMREVVLRSLGEKTLTGDELIMEVQRYPWENLAPELASIRSYFNADIIINSLLDLVRDGVVEMTSMRNFQVPIGQWVPKYRKVRSLRALKIEESIKSSRCMKIAKPWKQRDCNNDWITGGSAFS